MASQHHHLKQIEFLTRLLRIAEGNGSKLLEGNAHEALAVAYQTIQKNKKASEHHEMHLKIEKQDKDKTDEGNAYDSLGNWYISHSQYDEAIKALNIAKETGNIYGEGNASRNLGICYTRLCKYNKAIEHFKKCLNIAKLIEDKANEGKANRNLGNCYRCLGQYDKAIAHHKMHLSIAKQIGDKEGEGGAIGNLGTCYQCLGQYGKAIAHHKTHLKIAKQIGDKANEGKANGNLGSCYHCLGQYNKAIEHLEIHLNSAKQIEDQEGEGVAIGNLGTCYQCLGQYGKAIAHHKTHLKIAKQIGDKDNEGKANGNLGSCYHCLGQYNKAIEHLEIHLNSAKQIGDMAGEGSANGNLGNCYQRLGQYEKAIEHHEMYLNIAKQIGNKAGEGKANGNLGTCHHCLGQYSKAMEHLEIHLNIAKQIGDKAGEGDANGHLGSCYQCLGQFDKAITHHEMNLNIAKQIGDKAGEGIANGNLGSCYRYLGQYDKAKQHHKMHLSIAKQIGNKEGEGGAKGSLGNCYCCLGQYNKAIEYHEMHLNIAKQIRDKAGEGNAMGNLGICYQLLGQYNKGMEYHEMHLKFAKQIGNTDSEAVAYSNLGVCCDKLQQYDKAEECYRKSVESFEKLFKNAPKQDQSKVSILDTYVKTHILLVTILLRKDKNEALVIADRGRSRALAELLVNTRYLAQPTNAPEAKVLELREIYQVVEALGSTVIYFALLEHGICSWVIQRNGNGIDVLPPEDLNCQLANVSSYRLMELLIAKATDLLNPTGTVRCEDRSLSFLYPDQSKQTTSKREDDLPSAINPAEVPVAQQSSQRGRAPSPANVTTRSTIQTETGFLNNRTNVEESELNSVLKGLFQILFNPVRQFVEGSQVVVVPDGPLPLVPFAALVDADGHYVAETLQVRLVPSLATAKLIMERPDEPKRRASRPLIVGDPNVEKVHEGGKIIPVKRLPFAKAEVEMIGKLLSVEPFTAERATKESFLQNAESANLIHIAAHGNMESGEIMLAPSPGNSRKLEDVMLTITDLEQKRLRAKLVVLSCCHSGRGKVRAEGVIGIGRAFLGAGARAVLVTLWAVDDEATMYFMRTFYQHLVSGEKASGALKEAMKAMRETEIYRHPCHWAPFVLIGEDVAPFEQGEN